MSVPKRSEILNSNIVPLMFRLGWPVMLASLLETFYQLADTFWLGHLGGEQSGDSVAALQIAFPIFWFFASAAAGFSMSGAALVSQHTGAGDKSKANIASTQIISFSLLTGAAVALLGTIFAPGLLELVTSDKNISSIGSSYLVWFFPCMPFVFINASFRILSSAAGDTKTPLKITLVTNIINIVIDPIFIMGWGPIPRMGAAGAALATLISTALASFAVMYVLIKGSTGISLDFNHFIPEKKWFKKIVKIGFPAAVGHSADSLGFILLMAIIAKLPDSRNALAGYGIGNRLTSLIFIPAQGLGQGLTTIIGQSLGAEKFDRAWKSAVKGIKIISATIVLQVAILIPFREFFIALFIPHDTEIIASGAHFLLVFGISIPFFGVIRGATAAFNAAGTNYPAMIIGFVRLWLLRIPLSWLMGLILGFGATGIWVGMGISNVLAALLAWVLFVKYKWLKKVTD
ncbi:MAG: MATE family efflux transporter [bacterium]